MIAGRNRPSIRADYGLLNRSALVVKPQTPFLEWLHGSDPTSHELKLEDLILEPTVYLIPECESWEEIKEVLQELSEEIFVDQLDGWYRDESTWPKDRSFEVFRRWFAMEHHSTLMDLCDEPLTRES
jgi:hypothetical protein